MVVGGWRLAVGGRVNERVRERERERGREKEIERGREGWRSVFLLFSHRASLGIYTSLKFNSSFKTFTVTTP